MRELQFVIEKAELYEWPQPKVREAAADRYEGIKIVDAVAEQLLKDFKGNSLSDSNQTLKLRVKNLEAAAKEYRAGGSHKLDNRGRVVDRLTTTMEGLKMDLKRVQVMLLRETNLCPT